MKVKNRDLRSNASLCLLCDLGRGSSLASLSLDSFCFDEVTDPGVGFFFFLPIFIFIYLAALGLSCYMQIL